MLIKIVVQILFILVFPFYLAFRLLKGLWKIITAPFRYFKNRFISWGNRLMYKNYGQRKFFFYSNINRKAVEFIVFPLIDKDLEVYFIDNTKFKTWTKDAFLRTLILSHFKKTGFPYLVKVDKQGYTYISLVKEIKALKEGRLTALQFQWRLFDFFRDEGF